jgi:hypothetical protein
VHLPSVVLKSGPLVGMSCLQYELKNPFIKCGAHIVCNFTNICKTLAHRHQQFSLYAFLNKSHINDGFVVGHHNIVAVCTLPYAQVVAEKFSIEATDDVAVANKLTVASNEYTYGHFVAVDADDKLGDPVFAKVLSFVSNSDCSWYFVVEMWHTLIFNAHFHAFEVSQNPASVYRVISFHELMDYHALYCHRLSNNSQHYIHVPYHLF